jgi:hypothetical protein
MIYEEIGPITREAAEVAFRGGDPMESVKALLSLAYHDPDWRWVQERCLEMLKHPSETVRGAAVISLGHLARIHRTLDLGIVVPALEAVRCDAALAGKVEDAFDDIAVFVRG